MRVTREVRCHKLIRGVAKAIAGDLWELNARQNVELSEWRKMYPELTLQQIERRFIRLMWPKLVDVARKQLVGLLSLENIPSVRKNEIAEALILDNDLRFGRIMSREDLAKAMTTPMETRQ